MTCRERIYAASGCGEVDRQPRMAWLSEADAEASVCGVKEVGESGDRVILADVANPFGLALRKGIDLNKALRDDPTVGAAVLDGLVAEVRETINDGLKNGVDGIFYRLHGATPDHCSPMQYGGHYLERDREILAETPETLLKVLFVAGERELYIDFVSDLPAQVFAWDSQLTHISASDVREARRGAVASADPASDILLIVGKDRYLENLEQPERG